MTTMLDTLPVQMVLCDYPQEESANGVISVTMLPAGDPAPDNCFSQLQRLELISVILMTLFENPLDYVTPTIDDLESLNADGPTVRIKVQMRTSFSVGACNRLAAQLDINLHRRYMTSDTKFIM